MKQDIDLPSPFDPPVAPLEEGEAVSKRDISQQPLTLRADLDSRIDETRSGVLVVSGAGGTIGEIIEGTRQPDTIGKWFLHQLATLYQLYGHTFDEQVLYYLSSLLEQSTRASAMHLPKGYFGRKDDRERALAETLTALRFAAENADDRKTRAFRFRYLGDRALVIAGWFGDEMRKRLGSGVQYACDMGASGYRAAASITRLDHFEEMADSFPSLAELLQALQGNGTSVEARIELAKLMRERDMPTANQRMKARGLEPGLAPSGLSRDQLH